MQAPFIQTLFADRIGGKQFGLSEDIYKFEKIKRAKREAIQAKPQLNLIDLGVGEPDEMADQAVVRMLAMEAEKPENRFYADNGIQAFQEAAAQYMAEVFRVKELNPFLEINHVIGSKSALAMLPTAFINPGDVLLMPTPGYPVIATHTKYCGGEVVNLPLLEENLYLPKLDTVDPAILQKAKLLYINYPNNPTGAVATASFFEEVIYYAKKYQFLVVHDAAYGALVFDGLAPLSFLSIPGAKDVGVELHSLSKSFNMTGWRIGFIAGNESIVKAFQTIKDNSDSGQFIPIQKAATYALSHPEITERIRDKYERRQKYLADTLNNIGFSVQKPKGSFFLYTNAPKQLANGRSFPTAEAVSEYLIREHLISTVPWDDAGSYLRFSVTYEANSVEEEQRMMQTIAERLKKEAFLF
ncbi:MULTISPECIES: LL-diaminopimelate aminotransferase [unclassified Virgibacillus]|uniref:LL-diaminopimelate aminotransferase n=1 Tax=unclassified Virgibacillus TaxID=2620237 RepID=UPI0024DE5A3C|nr:LL-diaminopimelate aminotransferase [Virgibacillus sp. LDC-1]